MSAMSRHADSGCCIIVVPPPTSTVGLRLWGCHSQSTCRPPQPEPTAFVTVNLTVRGLGRPVARCGGSAPLPRRRSRGRIMPIIAGGARVAAHTETVHFHLLLQSFRHFG